MRPRTAPPLAHGTPAAVGAFQPHRGDWRNLREFAGGELGGNHREVRSVRHHVRGDWVQPTRLRGGRGTRQKRVLVLASITGGDRKIEVKADAINQGFVFGNNVMVGTVNRSRQDFVAASTTSSKRRPPPWVAAQAPHHTRVRPRELPGATASPDRRCGAVEIYLKLDGKERR